MPQRLEHLLLLVVVLGALLVVLLLLEQAQALPLEGLGALAVGASLDAVCCECGVSIRDFDAFAVEWWGGGC